MRGNKASINRGSMHQIKGAVTPEEEKLMLAFEINRLKLGWEVDCRRRRLIKMLDKAIQKRDTVSAMKLATMICSLDSEFCFGMDQKHYLKSRAV